MAFQFCTAAGSCISILKPLILHYTYAHTDIDMQTGWWVSAVVF